MKGQKFTLVFIPNSLAAYLHRILHALHAFQAMNERTDCCQVERKTLLLFSVATE